MKDQGEKKNREWLILLLLLPLGVMIMCLAGDIALAQPGTWRVEAEMNSALDPYVAMTSESFGRIEAVRAGIMTAPAWMDSFLTPGAETLITSFDSSTPSISESATASPLATVTLNGSLTPGTTVTATLIPSSTPYPTSTIYYPPPSTATKIKPPAPTSTKVKPPAPTKTNTPVPVNSADLAISKTDGVTTYAPSPSVGSAITYIIEIINLGPDDASGFNIEDIVPSDIAVSSVSCVTSGTGAADCGTDNTVGNAITFTGASIDFVGGNKITLTIAGTVNSSTTGSLSNTAKIVIPGTAPFTDPDTVTNNSATDTDSPAVDLQVTLVDDGKSSYIAGDTRTYTVTINNAGPFDLTGVGITSSFPAHLSNWTWTCSGQTGGASACDGAANNSADFSDSVDMPNGSSITYTVTTLTQGGGTLKMTVNATVPTGFIDTDPSNNSKTDSDQQIYSGNIGSEPDGSTSNISSGNSVTLAMTVNVNGYSGWDLIYYELPNGCGIAMDWVEIQVGDGSNWYTAFYWGDGIVDANSNLASLGLPETDGRSICSVDLYGATGVAIELDGVVPAGSYPYVKILAPPGDADGVVEVDAVTPLPIP